MPTVHALLVGIDDYPARSLPRLAGCRNDIRAAGEWLRARTAARGTGLRLRELVDGAATVEAVVAGLTGHFGGAAEGDTALLWFSGHGTDLPASGPDELLKEPTGRCQALVCADGTLPDKRLGALLEAVAARGVHTVAVLDCCYAGGGTREVLPVRYAPPAPGWARAAARDLAALPGHPGPQRHLLLAAGRLDQLAHEDEFDGRMRGLFSHALLDVLGNGAYDGASSREVMAATHARVQRGSTAQHPVLLPQRPGGPADAPLLGGAGAGPRAPHLLRLGVDGWEIDAGAAHGLGGRGGTGDTEAAGAAGAGGTCFAVVGAEPAASGADQAPGSAAALGPAAASSTAAVPVTASVPATAAVSGAVPGAVSGAAAGRRTLRAHEIRADRTLVRPEGWEPDPERTYPVTLSALALPPAEVTVEPAAGPAGAGDGRPVRLLREALAHAGPGGGPSPLLAVASGAGEAAVPRQLPAQGRLLLRVLVREGSAEVVRRDGSAFVPPLPLATADDAARVAACLVHLVQWDRIRCLDNPLSALGSPVRVEIAPADDRTAPPRPGDGVRELVCPYTRTAHGYRPPRLHIRLHNRTHRKLWCVLLDLTDSYRSHAMLFPGDFIGPRGTGHALDGAPVELSLPAGREPRPGAGARDWLKLVVAEGELNTLPFLLDAWDPGAPAGRSAARQAPDGVLRLAPPPPAARGRDLGPVGSAGASGSEGTVGSGGSWGSAVDDPGPGDWTATTLSLRTLVP
ncbi:caspase family protein [Streptomyces sp. NHF165]|uniref:caspase family protein n=1 Tax=Streptomyces sp. NHF165 TaxID=2175864 RepID=UPI001359FCBB|nr:caspase family protein [Streptomyces sp. NHF165]